MVKGLYQLPPRTRMELLHSNIRWSEGVDLINKGFPYAKGLHFYRQGIHCVDDVWDSNSHEFITWERAKEKFHLESREEEDWKEITDKIAGPWRHLLENDSDITLPGKWIGSTWI